MMRCALRLVLLAVPLAACGAGTRAVKPPVTATVPPPASTTTAAPKAPVAASFDVLLFEYDQSVVAEAHRDALRRMVDALLARPHLAITIEGHCDERGTDEYNLDLGWKRAYAIRDAFRRLGLDEARLYPVSYGRARPAVIGSDESVWRLNRRVEVSVRN